MVLLAGRDHVAGATRSRRPRRVRSLSRKDKVVLVLMLGVPLALDLAFIWLPTLATVALSFTKWTGVNEIHFFTPCKPPAVPGLPQPGCYFGVQNYVQAATVYPDFWPAVRHNAIWLGVFIVIATPLGILFAVILDKGIRGSRIYQSVLFLPVMLSLALIGIIWELIYSSNYGLINTVIGHNRNDNLIDWLGNPHLALPSVMLVPLWQWGGNVMIVFLAGLMIIPSEYYESARVDGVNYLQRFRYVTWPLLRPAVVFNLVISTIGSFKTFDFIFIMTNGGPGYLTEVLTLTVYNYTLYTARFGYGTAVGALLTVFVVVFCIVELRVLSRNSEGYI